MCNRIIVLVATLVLLASLAAGAETMAELKASMDKVADSFHGTLGYSLHFRGKPDESISRNGDEPFPTASTIKSTIMCEVLHQVEQGKIKWTDMVEVQPGTNDREEGGFAYYFKDGTKIPVREWVHLMITVSDNTATIRLRRLVGQKNVNEWLTSHDFKQTKLLNGEQTDELGLRPLQRKYGLGMTTPNEMAKLMDLIRDNKAGSPASCDRMMRILTHQYWDDGTIGQAPPYTHSASKTGGIGDTRSDVALVTAPKGEYVLTIYTKGQADESWSKMNEGNVVIRTLAAMVWRHFDPDKTWSPPEGELNLLPE
jgi:beta-lactamase class A